MYRFRTVLWSVAALALALSLAGYARAELIAADLQSTSVAEDYNGNEPAAAARDAVFDDAANVTWNHLEIVEYKSMATNPSFSDMVDRAGNATTVDFSVTGTLCGCKSTNSTRPLANEPLRQDYWFFNVNNQYVTTSSSLDFAFSDLEAGATYRLYFYGGNHADWTAERWFNTTVDTDGNGLLTDETAQKVGMQLVDTAMVVIDGYFTAVASADGTIIGNVDSTGTHESDWAGFQIAKIPEPSTLALLICGSLGLLAYAWRMRK